MLIWFSFSNLKSFSDKALISLSASNITEYSSHVVTDGTENILPVSVIYGVNGTGKTTVLEAFRFMTKYVINSLGFEEGVDERKTGIVRPVRKPYLSDNESFFEVCFTVESKTYVYGFEVDDHFVQGEWLHVSEAEDSEPKLVFCRGKDSLDLRGLTETSREFLSFISLKERLIVSSGVMLKDPVLKTVWRWFLDISFTDNENREIPDGFIEDKELQNHMAEYLSAFDPSIEGFVVWTSKIFPPEIYVKHTGGRKILLEKESSGTLKMFSLYSYIRYALKFGSILVIDDLDAGLHPMLVRGILNAFLNPDINRNHAQLIFTAHDPWLISSNMLRKDEIYFTDKGAEDVSVLTRVSKLEDAESFGEDYISGKYSTASERKDLEYLFM